MMEAIKVFVSYAHDDRRFLEHLQQHLKPLERDGVVDLWDDSRIAPGDLWSEEIRKALEEAAVAILLLSPAFLASDFVDEIELPSLLAAASERGLRVLPVVVRPVAEDSSLSRFQSVNSPTRPLVNLRTAGRDKVWVQLVEAIRELWREKGAGSGGEAGSEVQPVAAGGDEPTIELSRLPMPADVDLFVGRDADLELLDAAWRRPETDALQIVGAGGVGKSTIVWHWFERLRRDHYDGVAQAFAWSFYNQGQGDYESDSHAFLDAFCEHLAHVGVAIDPEARARPELLGKAAGRAFLEVGGLLVLDGLEALQEPPLKGGQLKDRGLAALVQVLRSAAPVAAGEPHRMVLITTQWHVKDLQGGGAEPSLDLDNLDDEAGAELLRLFRFPDAPDLALHLPNVTSEARLVRELEATSRAYDGHALSLLLLASYLLRYEGGNLARRSAVELEVGGHAEDPQRHARRVMERYDVMLQAEDDPLAGACRRLLLVLGLFDKPAPLAQIDAVLAGEPIPGLTDELPASMFRQALDELRRLRFVSRPEDQWERTVGTHPLVRKHFGTQLEREFPAAWSAAHGRLFDHLRAAAPELPASREQMEPLFEAVVHGCKAGRHAEALREVYASRIMRDKAAAKLGLIGPIFSSLSYFFAPGRWDEPVTLEEPDQLTVLEDAGTYLTAVRGYTAPEVEQVYRKGVEICKRIGDERRELTSLHGLWRYYLVHGPLATAEGHADEIRRLATKLDERLADLIADRAECSTNLYLGRFAAAAEDAARGLALRDHPDLAARDPLLVGELAAMCGVYGGLALWQLGRVEEGAAMSDGAVVRAEADGHVHTWVLSLIFNTWLHHFKGDTQAARRQAMKIAELTEEHGLEFTGALGRVLLGWVKAVEDRDEDGITEMTEGIRAWQDLGANLIVPYSLSRLAEGCWVLGRRNEALRALEAALALSRESGEVFWVPDLLRLRALYRHATGHPWSEVKADLDDAVRRAKEMGSRFLVERTLDTVAKLTK